MYAHMTLSGKVHEKELKHVGANNTPLLILTVRWSMYVGKGKGYQNSGYESGFLEVNVWANYATALNDQIQKDDKVTAFGEYQIHRSEGDGGTRYYHKLKADKVVLGHDQAAREKAIAGQLENDPF
jgi:hypothetical protein